MRLRTQEDDDHRDEDEERPPESEEHPAPPARVLVTPPPTPARVGDELEWADDAPKTKPTTKRPPPSSESPKMAPTAASLQRAETKKRNAQGLEGNDRRIRLCTSIKCTSSKDVRLGKFQMPAGTECARCHAPITAGVLVVERL